MSIFIYRALNKDGREEQGELQANDKETAVEYLKRDGFLALSLEEKGKIKKGGLSFLSQIDFLQSGVNSLDRMFLVRHLSAILKSGINLRESLEILEEDTSKPALKAVLTDAKKNLERGQPLSATFAAYENYFSSVFVGLIKAGEASGTLEETLEGLGEQLRRDYEMKKKVQSAMIYPAVLLGASSLIVILLLTFILPRLAKSLIQAKVVLPAITRFFIFISGVFSASPPLTIAIFILFVISSFLFSRRKESREFFIFILEKLPVSRELIKKLALARFTMTFRNLLKSGMSALDALDITAKTVGNSRYEAAIVSIAEEIRKGAPLHEVFKKRANLFPQLVSSIIAVGERTGTLEKSLLTIAEYYNEEVDRLLKNLVSLLEPILLVIMGIIVATIALSILLPIYQLVSSFR